MMYMKVAEFRKELSNCLDRAVQGETIKIERAGQVFNLELASPLQRITKRVKAIQESDKPIVMPTFTPEDDDVVVPPPEYLARQVATALSKPNQFARDEPKFCKHDAVLGMCKKGCK